MKKENKKTNAKNGERKLDKLEKTELLINAYNEMYGTSYSYGTFVADRDRDRLKPLPDIALI